MASDEGAALLHPGSSSKYDLTRTISKYLDLHMMFPLLDFVETNHIYPADQVAQARLDLLDAASMVRMAVRDLELNLGSSPFVVVGIGVILSWFAPPNLMMIFYFCDAPGLCKSSHNISMPLMIFAAESVQCTYTLMSLKSAITLF